MSKTNQYHLTQNNDTDTQCYKIIRQIPQLQTSPDQFLMFLIKGKTALLHLITSGALFQSMLPMNDIEFVPKEAVNALGRCENVFNSQIVLNFFSCK